MSGSVFFYIALLIGVLLAYGEEVHKSKELERLNEEQRNRRNRQIRVEPPPKHTRKGYKGPPPKKEGTGNNRNKLKCRSGRCKIN